MSTEDINLPNFDIYNLPKHPQYNSRVTYHCLLIPKGDAIRILTNRKNIELLNYIETRSLCLIRISSTPILPLTQSPHELGWWKLEIFYHQTHGNHTKCMTLLYNLLYKLGKFGQTFIHSIPIKTIKNMFPVNHKIKSFLENGCIRDFTSTIDDILFSESDDEEEEKAIKNYTNILKYKCEDKANVSLTTDCYPLHKAPIFIDNEWTTTNEYIDFISIHMMRQFLNPDNYVFLPDHMKSLNLKNTINKIATIEIKNALLSTVN